MEIEFEDKKLERKLATLAKAKKAFGDKVGGMIFYRINQLEVALDESELHYIPGNFHPLTADRKGQWACSLTANWRMVFRLKIEEDYIAVIIEIVDYH